MQNIVKAAAVLAAMLMLSALPNGVSAQEAAAEPLELGPSGEAYLRAKPRHINANVGYYDPTRKVPPLETRQRVRPEPEERQERNITLNDSVFMLFLALVLGFVAYLFIRFGGGMSVSLRSQSEDATREVERTDRATPGALDAENLQPVRAILRNPDRKLALIQLARALLVQVVEANGLLLQRSWTARDALRRLPRTQPHLSALQSLVLASERIQFGNREISEDEFQNHVQDVTPLLSGAAK